MDDEAMFAWGSWDAEDDAMRATDPLYGFGLKPDDDDA